MDFLIGLGRSASLLALVAVMLFWYLGMRGFGIRIAWRCGICGKLNETNILQFMLCWCDHTGDCN